MLGYKIIKSPMKKINTHEIEEVKNKLDFLTYRVEDVEDKVFNKNCNCKNTAPKQSPLEGIVFLVIIYVAIYFIFRFIIRG